MLPNHRPAAFELRRPGTKFSDPNVSATGTFRPPRIDSRDPFVDGATRVETTGSCCTDAGLAPPVRRSTQHIVDTTARVADGTRPELTRMVPHVRIDAAHSPSYRRGMRRLWVVLAAATLLLGSPSLVSAHPYGDSASDNHGWGRIPSYLGAQITDIDGIRANYTVHDLNAPRSCGSAGTTNTSTCRAREGGNLRIMQINAQAPPAAVARDEFIGYGYGVGCFDGGDCSGPTGSTTGSYRERIYVDGVGTSGYFFNWHDDLTVGSEPRIELIWYLGDWFLALNGTHKWTLVSLEMRSGFGAYGAETEMAGSGQATSKVQNHFFFLERKQVNGNYLGTNQTLASQPHSTCTSTHANSAYVGWYISGTGTC